MMRTMMLNEGTGRTSVSLSTQLLGNDLVVFIYNEHGHIGAVAVADYSADENRASTSVITRLGHKDDLIARSAAYKICKFLKRPVCVIAGVHLDEITEEETAELVRNCDRLVESLQYAVGSQD
jgi:hypothetical protein